MYLDTIQIPENVSRYSILYLPDTFWTPLNDYDKQPFILRMSGSIVGLGDLPNETLLEIFKHLSANQDIPNVSLVCQRFNQVTCNDSLWAHFAKQDYGVDIKLTTTSSVKIIYQRLLNIFGPLLGLYKA